LTTRLVVSAVSKATSVVRPLTVGPVALIAGGVLSISTVSVTSSLVRATSEGLLGESVAWTLKT
jgi:hypothetical protein